MVSTRLGAEGLADRDGEICALADQPANFARYVIDLLRDPQKAAAIWSFSRGLSEFVVAKTRYPRNDGAHVVEGYRAAVLRKRATLP